MDSVLRKGARKRTEWAFNKNDRKKKKSVDSKELLFQVL